MTSATGTRVRKLSRSDWFVMGFGLFMIYQAMCLIWSWTIPETFERLLEHESELLIMLAYPTVLIALGCAFVGRFFVRRELRRILREEYEVVNDD